MKSLIIFGWAAATAAVSPLYFAISSLSTTPPRTSPSPFIQKFASVVAGGAFDSLLFQLETSDTPFVEGTSRIKEIPLAYDVSTNTTYQIFAYADAVNNNFTWFGTIDVSAARFTKKADITASLARNWLPPSSIAALNDVVYFLDDCHAEYVLLKAIKTADGAVSLASNISVNFALFGSIDSCNYSTIWATASSLYVSIGNSVFLLQPTSATFTIVPSASLFFNAFSSNATTPTQYDPATGKVLVYSASPAINGFSSNVLTPITYDLGCSPIVVARPPGSITGGIIPSQYYRTFSIPPQPCTIPTAYCSGAGVAAQGYVIAGNVAGSCTANPAGGCVGVTIACAPGFNVALGSAGMETCARGSFSETSWSRASGQLQCIGAPGANDGRAVIAAATDATTIAGVPQCSATCTATIGSVVLSGATYLWQSECSGCVTTTRAAIGSTTTITTTCTTSACCDTVLNNAFCTLSSLTFTSCTCPGVAGYACPARNCGGSKKALLGLLGLLGLIPLILCSLLSLLIACCLIRRQKTETDVHFATFDPHTSGAGAPPQYVTPSAMACDLPVPSFVASNMPMMGGVLPGGTMPYCNY